MIAPTDTRLATAQAARLAGVSENSIRAWCRAGVLPHDATPLGTLIRRADLAALIAARERRQRERVRTRQLRLAPQTAPAGASGRASAGD